MTYNLMLTWADDTRKLQTIKAVRGVTGMGLKEARDLVHDFCGRVEADRQAVLLTAYDTADAAHKGLAKLRETGGADGTIEQTVSVTDATQTAYSKAEVMLMLADAISLARDQSHWKPSVIINSALGA